MVRDAGFRLPSASLSLASTGMVTAVSSGVVALSFTATGGWLTTCTSVGSESLLLAVFGSSVIAVTAARLHRSTPC
jgi:hypothetical protein